MIMGDTCLLRSELQQTIDGYRKHGIRIVAGTCTAAPGPGVDTEQELERARTRAARGAGSTGGSQ